MSVELKQGQRARDLRRQARAERRRARAKRRDHEHNVWPPGEKDTSGRGVMRRAFRGICPLSDVDRYEALVKGRAKEMRRR